TVLQETSDDAAHADVVADTADAGPQTADPPHDEVDARTRLGGQAQLLDHVLVAERIYLEDHVRGITLAGPGRFALDQFVQPLPQVHRCDEQRVEIRRRAVASERVEERSRDRKSVV